MTIIQASKDKKLRQWQDHSNRYESFTLFCMVLPGLSGSAFLLPLTLQLLGLRTPSLAQLLWPLFPIHCSNQAVIY